MKHGSEGPLRNKPHGTRRWIALPAAVFGACFLMALVPASASAGSAYSSYGYYTVDGHQYENQAEIVTVSDYAEALTYNQWTTETQPAGWAGARGRLFTSGGSLKCQSAIVYNFSDDTMAEGYCSSSTHGAWYSYGVAYGFTGSGYQPFYTFISPNQNS